MGGDSDDSPGSETVCEECGATGARPLEVRYGDGNSKTFVLCEECLQEYRAADLIEEMALLEDTDSQSLG